MASQEVSYHLVVVSKKSSQTVEALRASKIYTEDQTPAGVQTVLVTSKLGEIKECLPRLFQQLADPREQAVQVIRVQITSEDVRCLKCLQHNQPCSHLGKFNIGQSRVFTVKPDNYLAALQ